MRNLTPHPIRVVRPDGEIMELPPSGQVARVAAIETPAGDLDGIPLVSRTWGQVENLPAPEPGVFLVVSSLVFEAARDRNDLLVPDTGPTAVRDASGQVVAVRRLVARREGRREVKNV